MVQKKAKFKIFSSNLDTQNEIITLTCLTVSANIFGIRLVAVTKIIFLEDGLILYLFVYSLLKAVRSLKPLI